MKHSIYAMTIGAVLASCADEFDQNISVPMPQTMKDYAYLSEYKPLKDYVSNPNFMLGGALAVSDFNNGGVVYQLAASNFREVVAGNAMKMASCVDSKTGAMNFGNVTSFVNNAEAAGLNVYGHTLAWHAQQPKDWLMKLIADKEVDIDPNQKNFKEISKQTYTDGPFPFYAMGCEPPVVDGAIHFEPTGAWSQFFCMTGCSMGAGNYALILRVKSSKEGVVTVDVQNGWGGDAQKFSQKIAVKADEWVDAEVLLNEVAGGNYDVIFKPETFDGVIDLQSVTLGQYETPAFEVETEVVSKTYTDGPFPFYAMGCEPPVVDGAIHFVPDGAWSQFFCLPGGENALSAGTYAVYFEIKSSKAGSIKFTVQNGWGGDAESITGNVALTEGWTTSKSTIVLEQGGNYDVILKPETFDATLDLKSVTFKKIEKMNSIPMTAQEKKDTLTWAMDRWIAGMMAATGGKVTAWDAVNEAISGRDSDGDGWYDLQHAETANGDNGVSPDFFWQDYLGDIDYMRIVISSARRHFKANGGEGDLKLFVNDYNLESTWDNVHKVKSLVNWIGKWENDTVKIDGIGTQMHISYNENPEHQAWQEECIVNMFKIMAETGKLVRVSELDMGYVDANGNKVLTADMTEEQHKNMAKFYTFIVEKYFELVPTAQQYGITQWCITDSPASSSWRGGEPVGLWTLDYQRKHTYAGFADGLK